MNKKEALENINELTEKIEELKEFVEECDRKSKLEELPVGTIIKYSNIYAMIIGEFSVDKRCTFNSKALVILSPYFTDISMSDYKDLINGDVEFKVIARSISDFIEKNDRN